MDPYGSLWVSMGRYGALWVSMGLYVSLWIPMDPYGSLWGAMGRYGAHPIPSIGDADVAEVHAVLRYGAAVPIAVPVAVPVAVVRPIEEGERCGADADPKVPPHSAVPDGQQRNRSARIQTEQRRQRQPRMQWPYGAQWGSAAP